MGRPRGVGNPGSAESSRAWPRRSCRSGQFRFCFQRGRPGRERPGSQPRAPKAVTKQAQPPPSLRGRSAGLLRSGRCGSAGARARPGHLRPRHLVQGRQAQGRPPASILYLPSCPSPPLQPSPVAPLRAPRGPAAPDPRPQAMLWHLPLRPAWLLGRVAPGPRRHGCLLRLLVGAVRGEFGVSTRCLENAAVCTLDAF